MVFLKCLRSMIKPTRELVARRGPLQLVDNLWNSIGIKDKLSMNLL